MCRGKKMSRKILTLLIIVVAIGGTYALFYAAVSTVLIPMDINSYKSELETAIAPVNNELNISEIESGATVTESIPLTYIPQEERTEMANQMRKGNTIPIIPNQDFNEYDKFNSYRILAYNLIFRGDISKQIKNISNTHEEIIRLNNETNSITEKMAADLEKGDNKAYADDLRNISNNVKQYNIVMEKLKTQIKDLINLLEQ